MAKRIVRMLVDGNNVLHWARHRYADSVSEDGRPLGALCGMLRVLDRSFERFEPDEIVVLMDSFESWRKSVFPGYKEGRRKRHERFTDEERDAYQAFSDVQIPDVMRMLAGFGIPVIRIPHMEADDLIAVLASEDLRSVRLDDVIVSTDRDMLQLVEDLLGNSRVRVWNQVSDGVFYQEPGGELCLSGTRIAPSPLIYLWRRVVVGDASDSIPGVPGVGEIGATYLFDEEERNGEGLAGYLNRRCEWFEATKKGRAVLEARSVVIRNHGLMMLSPGCEGRLMTEVGGQYRKGMELVYGAGLDDCVLKGSRPPFLRGRPEADPSPGLGFFRRRGMRIGFNPLEWRATFEQFEKLHRRRIPYHLARRIELPDS